MADKLDKKQRIMQAMEKLFRLRQFHEVTLDEVAQEADVGKGTIYLYFADKNDLFFQTAVAGFEDMCELLRQSRSEHLAAREELLQACTSISSFFLRRRPLFRMIVAEGERILVQGGSLKDRWLEHRKKLTEALAAVISRAMASGDFRTDIPADVAAEYLLGMLKTRAIELEDRPERLREHSLLIDLFVNGMAGTPVPLPRKAVRKHI